MIDTHAKNKPIQHNRQHGRINTHRPAELIVGDQPLMATLTNLSSDGVGFLTNSKLEIKQQLRIKFCLPNYDQRSELTLYGEVTHCSTIGNQYLIGLQFAELTPHQNLVITGFINFHRRLEDD